MEGLKRDQLTHRGQKGLAATQRLAEGLVPNREGKSRSASQQSQLAESDVTRETWWGERRWNLRWESRETLWRGRLWDERRGIYRGELKSAFHRLITETAEAPLPPPPPSPSSPRPHPYLPSPSDPLCWRQRHQRKE